jgi:HD-GYP domain-containing protein (c-di-GMP phosphodiesterase class II)
VCDAFDAMTTHRPYRDPMTEAEAITELQRCGGSQFDPDVVAAFCRVIAREQPSRGEVLL